MSIDIYDGAIPDPIYSSSDMLSITSLMEDIMYLLPGVSDVMVRKVLADVYRDFCKRTAVLVKSQVSRDITPDNPIMILCDGLGDIGIVRAAMVDDREIPLEVVVNDCGCVGVNFKRRVYNDDIMHEYRAVYSIVPKVGCEIAPTWFLNRYGSAIVNGALFKLQSMTGKPWSDPAQANMNALRYTDGLNNATVDRLTKTASGDLNCRARLPWII